MIPSRRDGSGTIRRGNWVQDRYSLNKGYNGKCVPFKICFVQLGLSDSRRVSTKNGRESCVVLGGREVPRRVCVGKTSQEGTGRYAVTGARKGVTCVAEGISSRGPTEGPGRWTGSGLGEVLSSTRVGRGERCRGLGPVPDFPPSGMETLRT